MNTNALAIITPEDFETTQRIAKAMVKGTIGEVRRRDKIGLAGRSLVIWNACPDCGQERWSLLSLFRKRQGHVLCPRCIGRRTVNQNNLKWWNESEHRQNCRCARCADQWGANNAAWKGGVRYRGGYRFVKLYSDSPFYSMTDANGYVMEHRLVMAQKLDRPLKKGETVHHINGIKDDNRFENLELWYTNHGHGVRVKDMLRDWARLYDYHCLGCNCGGRNE